MQIFKQRLKRPRRKRLASNVAENEASEKKVIKSDLAEKETISSIKKENKKLSGAEINLNKRKRILQKGKNKFSLGVKAKQGFAKFAAYAGLISIANSTGNACKGIASNPLLMGIGIGLIAVSIGAFLWSLFS